MLRGVGLIVFVSGQNTLEPDMFANSNGFDLYLKFKKAIKNFRDDSGSTTVEFVLWVPVFLVILALTVDVSLMFLRQSNMWHVARDTVRQVSLRQLTTEAQATTYATEHATYSGDVPNVVVNIDRTNQYAQVRISVPIKSAGVFGVLNIGGENDLVAVVTQRLEPI